MTYGIRIEAVGSWYFDTWVKVLVFVRGDRRVEFG